MTPSQENVWDQMKNDKRFSFDWLHVGYPTKRCVFSFCNNYVDNFETKEQAITFAVDWNLKRIGVQ